MKVFEHPNPLCKDWMASHIVFLLNRPVLPGVALPDGLQIMVTRLLRDLVNRWIDSGRGADGIDTPHNRSVYWLGAGGKKPLGDVLLAWNRRHAKAIQILSSGERTINLAKPKREPSGSPNELFYDPQPENEYEAGEIAIYWLQQLLELPASRRIGRCENQACRAPYYLRERLRKEPIRHGTYCDRCTYAGSKRRVDASRSQRKQRLVNLAADFWEGYRPSQRYLRKADWLATEMNKRLRPDRRIRGKWVTQNQKAIEGEVERRRQPKLTSRK